MNATAMTMKEQEMSKGGENWAAACRAREEERMQQPRVRVPVERRYRDDWPKPVDLQEQMESENASMRWQEGWSSEVDQLKSMKDMGRRIAQGPVDTLLEERGATHGDWRRQAGITSDIKKAMRRGVSWGKLRPEQAEALDMIATKLGRISEGNPDEPDHWADITGYARLAEKTLREEGMG